MYVCLRVHAWLALFSVMIAVLTPSCCPRPYFDLCDGIFLNYNWTQLGLEASRSLAGNRRGEVYVGIDVFGRGCPGGGGFNSCEVSVGVCVCLFVCSSANVCMCVYFFL